jgi:hypothetical protein
MLCARHGAVIEGESPLWDLSEVTMSEKQLHEPTAPAEVGALGPSGKLVSGFWCSNVVPF